MPRTHAFLIWTLVTLAVALPLLAAAQSPQLAWRDPVYIAAGFAGILAMSLMCAQPVLAAKQAPGIAPRQSRRLHRWTGGAIVAAILVHVGGLWLTSPPDVIDALTFNSPTPFSLWGVIGMWLIFFTAALALRYRRFSPRQWRRIHLSLTCTIIFCTILHVMLIEGTMALWSKYALSALLFALVARAIIERVKQRPSESRASP